MWHLAKIHVLLVAAAVVFGSLAAGNASHPDAPSAPAQNAGCHEHSQAPKPVPANRTPDNPAPVSYDCCQNGHGIALVRAVEVGSRDLTIVALNRVSVDLQPRAEADSVLFSSIPSTGEPPGLTPLRI